LTNGSDYGGTVNNEEIDRVRDVGLGYTSKYTVEKTDEYIIELLVLSVNMCFFFASPMSY
jgi:hypothetical protein